MAVAPRYRAPQSSDKLVDHLRALIEAAERDGVDRSDMRLNLTLRDTSALRRNRDLDVAALRFADGEMWFMDVQVVTGGVERSDLVRAGAD